MAKHIETGREAENRAQEYLVERGFEILVVNFRHGRNEIDIIARKKRTMVFVEVKARGDTNYGYPEDSVDDKKAERIREAAEEYLEENKWDDSIRFDIISVINKSNGDSEISHFEDAF